MMCLTRTAVCAVVSGRLPWAMECGGDSGAGAMSGYGCPVQVGAGCLHGKGRRPRRAVRCSAAAGSAGGQPGRNAARSRPIGCGCQPGLRESAGIVASMACPSGC